MEYPSYFPCPSWNYSRRQNPNIGRSQFSSGWTRQRNIWPEKNTFINMQMVMKTETFAGWSAWFESNAHQWFGIELEGEREVVRAISDVNYNYDTFDNVIVNFTVEKQPEAASGTKPPVPSPPQPGRPPIPGTEIYCLEYECDAYDVYLSGTGEYYWPGYNPVSDGYLEGTVNLPANGGFTNGGALFPDACVGDDGWISTENAYLDGAQIFEQFSTVGEYSFSTLYKFFSGNSDENILVHTLGWRYGSSGIGIEVSFIAYLNGDLQAKVAFSFGAGSIPLNLVINGVIPNDGIPHVIGFTIGLPGEIVPAGSTVPIPVSLQVDGKEVGTGEATGDFYNAGGDWVFAPDFPGQTNRLWFMAGSTNNYFSNMAMNGGGVDLSELRNAYLQNFTEYNDPDPDCIPRPTQNTDPLGGMNSG